METDIHLHTLKNSKLWEKYGKVPGFMGMFLTITAIFLIVPLFSQSLVAHLLLQGFFTFLVTLTIYTLSKERLLLFLGSTLIIIFMVFDAISLWYDSIPYLCIAYLFYTAFILLADLYLLRGVLKAPVINTNLIFGAFMVYFFSGIFWGNIYFLIEAVQPASFHGILPLDLYKNSLWSATVNHFDALYYSFTIISTLGLGDITPVSHLVRSLTILEAAFGQLFVATVIAKLVSVWKEREY